MNTCQLLLISSALAAASAGQNPRATPACIPPGAMVDVSSHLINAVVQRPVDKTDPVRDVIIDTEVFGMSHTRGLVQARTLPDANRAWLDVFFIGTSQVKGVGVYEPVKAYNWTTLNFEVHQPITIDGKSVRSWTPVAWARAYSRLLGVTDLKGDPDSIVVGPARYQFYDDKCELETVTARKSEIKLKSEFRAELRPELDKLARSLKDAMNALEWLGVPLPPLRWSSTAASLRLTAGQLSGAPLTAPPEPSSWADITLRVHQATLRQITQKHLAGKTFSPFDLAALNEKILRFSSGKGQSGPATSGLSALEKLLQGFGVQASITFAEQDPVTLQFADGGLTLILHGKSFKVGNNVYPARDIVTRYRLDAMPGDVALVRDGPVKVLAVGAYPDMEDAKNKEIESVLQNNFTLYLPARLPMPTINSPGMSLVLAPSQAEARNGWLLLAWTKKAASR